MFELLIILVLPSHYCSYHGLSQRTLIPPPGLVNSFYGYSLGYQSHHIVIGAPHADKIGQMFKCNVNSILDSNKNSIVCNKTIWNASKLHFHEIDVRNQSVTLWSSIASTSNYVTTCSSLFGECFMYNTETDSYLSNIKHSEEHFYTERIKNQGRWAVMPGVTNDSVLVMRFLADSLKDQKNLEISYINQKSQSIDKLQSWIMEDGSTFLGHTIGKFFSNLNASVYAISSFTDDLRGRVRFLKMESDTEVVGRSLKTIKDNEKGAMYGTELHSEDFNGDGLSELIVAAPSHASGVGFECGAVYIYIGGDMDLIDRRKCKLFSNTDGGRFGVAIATSDINGDGVPELFVSAPFEGFGKVYVFSGVDIRQLLQRSTKWEQDISEMNTEILRGERSQGFGSSLYILPDIDNNGCNELLIGSPYNDNVKLYRCVPTVNVAVTTFVEDYETVPENVTNFIVNICIHISYPIKPNRINTNITIQNNIKRRDAISKQLNNDLKLESEDAKYKIELSKRIEFNCKKIIIDVSSDDPGRYTFTTIIDVERDIFLIKEFDTTWVKVDTIKKKHLEITRGCNGSIECVPKLHMTLHWSIKKEGYKLGGNSSEHMSVTVYNTGTSANNACIKIQTVGLRLTRSDTLYLPKPFKNLNTFEEIISLDLGLTTNMNETVQITAELYKRCNDDIYDKQHLRAKVLIETDNIIVQGFSRNFNVKISDINKNETDFIVTEHRYSIINAFIVPWRNFHVDIFVQKNAYLFGANILDEFQDYCTKTSANEAIEFNCEFDVKPMNTANLFITLNVKKDIATKHAVDGRVTVSSKINVDLLPTNIVKDEYLESEIIFEEMKFYNNKEFMVLICVLLGILFLVIITFVLYKVGFFNRKEKAKLIELKKEIRRQSARHTTSGGVEGINDNVFENISMCDDVFSGEENTLAERNERLIS